MKRYVWLLVAGVILSLGALAVARTARFAAPPRDAASEAPVTTLSLTLGADGMEPRVAAVPKGHRVMLAVRNGRAGAVTIALQGYEDRFTAGPIAPGQTWRGAFTADRPGDDFAWVADGVALGRLSVTGSHLVEGHR